jgi:hypothetical protein
VLPFQALAVCWQKEFAAAGLNYITAQEPLIAMRHCNRQGNLNSKHSHPASASLQRIILAMATPFRCCFEAQAHSHIIQGARPSSASTGQVETHCDRHN